MPNISYNVKLIFESDSQKSDIVETLKAEQFVFNECSKMHFGSPRNSIVELHAKVYGKIRRERPDIPSQIVIRGENACLSAYRSIKSNRHKITKPVEKDKLAMRLDKRLYKFIGPDSIKLTNINGRRITAKLHTYPKFTELSARYNLCDPLIFERNGEIWLTVTFDIPDPKVIADSVTGIDLGIKRAVTTSDGVILRDKKFNREKRKLRYLKRQLQSCGTKSAKKHLRKLQRKERNKNRDQSYKLANFIIRNCPTNTIAIENLTGIKQNTFSKWNKKQNGKWAQVPVMQLITILSYKALLSQKTVIRVNPSFTSQIDCRTGEKDGIRKGCQYMCKDRTILDADVNAAINIRVRGYKSLKLPDFGPKNAIFGQAVVTRPIVCQFSQQSEHSDLPVSGTLQAPEFIPG